MIKFIKNFLKKPLKTLAFFFYIQYNEYYAKVTGHIVTVKKAAAGKWKYCVVVSEMDEKNRQEYLQIIYDREHTLPKKLSKNSSYFGDIVKNLSKRTEVAESSRRQTARIMVNETCELNDGNKVLLENYNFEFVRLSAVGEGSLPAKLTLFPGSAYELYCEQSDINPNVYAITNWEALVDNKEFMKVVKEWSSNAKEKKRR